MRLIATRQTRTQPLYQTRPYERKRDRSPTEEVQDENIAHAMKLLPAREHVLTLSEQRVNPWSYSWTDPHCRTASYPSHPPADFSPNDNYPDVAPIISHKPTLAHLLFVAALLTCSNPDSNLPSLFLDVLAYLPPTLPTFDLMGRLLRDPTPTATR
jgi:hypothetical protein